MKKPRIHLPATLSALSALIVLSFIYQSCTTGKNAFEPGEKRYSSEYLSSCDYSRQIKEKTNLIKSVISDTTIRTFKGIYETHIRYTNNGDSCMAIHFLRISFRHTGLLLETATPFDSLKYGFQTVMDMIPYKNKHVETKNEKVVAAVNADYFFIKTTGAPLGIVYKNSRMIMPWTDSVTPYFYFGMLKNDRPVIGDKKSYLANRHRIREALGGRYYILKNNIINTDGLTTKPEPRTAVGILGRDEIIFVLVDGRQPGYSYGLSLKNLAELFKAIGATDALNLDGGGSSTLIVADENGRYNLKNKLPGSQRAVSNAWMILRKE